MSVDVVRMLAEAEAEAAKIEAEDRAAWRKMCTPSAEREAAAARRWAEHDYRWRTPFYNPHLDAQGKSWLSENRTGEARRKAVAKLAGQLLRGNIEPYGVLDLCQIWNLYHCLPPLLPEEVNSICDWVAGREFASRKAAA
jgi:hypothetical protein